MRVVSAGKQKIYSLGFAPNSCELLASIRRRGVVSFGPAGSEPPRSISPLTQLQFYFTPDGESLFLHGRQDIRKVDLATLADSSASPPAQRPLYQFTLSSDCARLVTSHGTYNGGQLIGWRASNSGWEEDWITPEISMRTYTPTLSPTGDRLAYVAEAPQPRAYPRLFVIKTRSALTGEEEATGEYHYASYNHFLFSPYGQQFIAYHKPALLVWSVPEMGKPRIVRNDNLRHFTDVAYHPTSRYLFSTSNDATVVVWDTQSWEPVKRFTWKIGSLKSVAIAPDGTVAAAGSEKGEIVVWDLDL